jgi:hypothetical protein
MEKVKFRTSEVIAYLEDKILSNMATEDETVLYEDYQWSKKLDKTNYTYKMIVVEMRKLHEDQF